ncbi:hypothetical protein NKH45_11055 [Mesorhizobium sp. M1156]|uniref:hypothetical protein n=1 Tax=unclassified Mesorhizobium TaxID=325217 RepID=UPI00333CBCD9
MSRWLQCGYRLYSQFGGKLAKPLDFNGRSGRIRTDDPLTPGMPRPFSGHFSQMREFSKALQRKGLSANPVSGFFNWGHGLSKKKAPKWPQTEKPQTEISKRPREKCRKFSSTRRLFPTAE